MKDRVLRALRTAGALALLVALAPVTGAPATASQSGEDHKVTLCHRTNSEQNPYVVITVDKAGVFKTGHDSHDEGGVYRPGDKARGVRWGDIIPPFTYYAGPQDERNGTVSEYEGLNWTADGQAVYNNGCAPTPPPPPPPGEEKQEPAGVLVEGRCIEEDGSFVVNGRFDSKDYPGTAWRLALSTGDTIALTASPFQETIDAPAGTTVTLQFAKDGRTWEVADDPVTVTECPPDEQVPNRGDYSAVCDADGAVVTIGDLQSGEGVTWVLRVNGAEQPVTEGQVVQVPGEASLALVAVKGRTRQVVKSSTAPAACPEQGTVDKTSSPAPGSTVVPGSTIAYTVTVTNTGRTPLVDKKVVDTLPSFVTVQGSPSDGGVVSADGRTITWTVTLAPAASKTFTYAGLVSSSVPPGTTLVNTVTFLDQRDETAHPVGQRGLAVVKSVDKAVAEVGETLTYTLAVTATGTLPQTNVVVTDRIPAGTTYVTGSVGCTGGCPTAPTVADGLVTWSLGGMAAGASRTVSFQVTIDRPAGDAAPADVRNTGVARSGEVGETPSNEVVTEVTGVAGVKVGQPGASGDEAGEEDVTTAVRGTKAGNPATGVLASTGASVPVGAMVALAGALVLTGMALLRLAAGRRRGL